MAKRLKLRGAKTLLLAADLLQSGCILKDPVELH